MDIGIKSEIAELVDRYLCSLDERNFDEDWARRFFTEDAAVAFPIGNAEGIDEIEVRPVVRRAGRQRDAAMGQEHDHAV